MTKTEMELESDRADVQNPARVAEGHAGKLGMEDVEIDETIAELNAERAKLKRLAAAESRVRRNHARACAKIAATDREYFQLMCKLMDPLVEICPSHPLIRQWPKVRKVWAEQLLKAN